MTDNTNILSYLLQNPQEPVNKQWVLNMLQTHSCFYLPAALLLKRNPDGLDKATLQRLHSAVMMNCADRTAIIDYVDPNNAGWDAFYPKEEIMKSPTDQTIDDFIQRFGHISTPEEDAVLERLILNPVPGDYFGGTEAPLDPSDPLSLPPELMKKDDSEKAASKENETEQSIETTEKEPAESPGVTNHSGPLVEPSAGRIPVEAQDDVTHTESSDSANEESLLTESLVKIFIKRHNYERALDIISRLSLNYPEKSVYFADQKRFLKKLIINQQYLNGNK